MLTKAGCTFAPDGPCLLGECGLTNQASSCLKTNSNLDSIFHQKSVDSEMLISPNFNVMTLNITWLLGYSQSSAAVGGTSCALSPNSVAPSILSPETLPSGHTARERWDHIPSRQSESRTVPLKVCFWARWGCHLGTYRKCILSVPAWTCWIRSRRWRPATHPIYAHLPYVLRT